MYVVLQDTQCQPGISNYPTSEVHINIRSDYYNYWTTPIIELDTKNLICLFYTTFREGGLWLDYSCISACHYSTTVRAYSFLRADFLFSSLSSWAASRSLTSEPGALAGIISSWSSLLWKMRQRCLCCVWHVWWSTRDSLLFSFCRN